MSTSPALVIWDALTLSNAIHVRDVSCREVMNTYLDHINTCNASVNAIVSLRDRDELLIEADEYLRTMFEHYDYLALPTAQIFPFLAELDWPTDIAGRSMDAYHRWMEVVIPGSLSRCPVISVPAGFSAEGLPMGIQLIGRHQADLEVLQIARAYEQASGDILKRLPPSLAGLMQ